MAHASGILALERLAPAAPPPPHMDPLSDIFRTLRIRSTLYFRTALGAPWGIAVPAHGQVARFHLVLDGSCRITTQAGDVVALGPGDLALVPGGAPHELRSDAGVCTVAVDDVLDETAYDGRADLFYGGDGARTTMVCGHFAFEDQITHPIVDALPSLVHIRATDDHDFTWLDAATRTIGRESARRLPGWNVVVDRACEILFVQVLRLQFDQPTGSVAAAFLDEQLSRSLSALHEAPGKNWDLESLARAAGMSRTSFAVRFRELMGMPPMTYLTRWRLQKARLALVESNQILTDIATAAGYSSEAAFSRAFQRLYGAPPGTYRQAVR